MSEAAAPLDGGDAAADERAGTTDGHAARRGIEARAAAIRDEQLERAYSQLDARDALTDERARVLDALADRLIEALLDAPERAIADADDPAEAERVRALFDAAD